MRYTLCVLETEDEAAEAAPEIQRMTCRGAFMGRSISAGRARPDLQEVLPFFGAARALDSRLKIFRYPTNLHHLHPTLAMVSSPERGRRSVR